MVILNLETIRVVHSVLRENGYTLSVCLSCVVPHITSWARAGSFTGLGNSTNDRQNYKQQTDTRPRQIDRTWMARE